MDWTDVAPTGGADALDQIAAERAAPLAEGWRAFGHAVWALCVAALVGGGIVALSAPAVALFVGR